MTDQHPITPPQWQVDAWHKQAMAMGADVDAVLLEAVRWGYEQRGADIEDKLQKARDEELEACCNWLPKLPPWSADDLRKHRRPKPPSLKEQALAALNEADQGLNESEWQQRSDTIRRALEALDD